MMMRRGDLTALGKGSSKLFDKVSTFSGVLRKSLMNPIGGVHRFRESLADL
jgi:hypothetical protein